VIYKNYQYVIFASNRSASPINRQKFAANP